MIFLIVYSRIRHALRSGVYRNGFGVLRFRNLACIPRPGRGGDREVVGRVEKNTAQTGGCFYLFFYDNL